MDGIDRNASNFDLKKFSGPLGLKKNHFNIFSIFSGNAGVKNFFEDGDLVAAVVSSIKSSKSELSSRFFGHLKFLEACTGWGRGGGIG